MLLTNLKSIHMVCWKNFTFCFSYNFYCFSINLQFYRQWIIVHEIQIFRDFNATSISLLSLLLMKIATMKSVPIWQLFFTLNFIVLRLLRLVVRWMIFHWGNNGMSSYMLLIIWLHLFICNIYLYICSWLEIDTPCKKYSTGVFI